MEIIDVVVKWAGTVVAVERLGRGERFTIGAAAAGPRHFVWHHPALDVAAHAVVAHTDDGFELRGVRGGLLVIDGARAPGMAATLRGATRASFVLGAIEIEARRAERSRAAPVARELDARFLRVSGTALVLHAGLVCALLLAREAPAGDQELPRTTTLIAEAWAARPMPQTRSTSAARANDLEMPRARAQRAMTQRPRAVAAPRDARTLARAALSALGLDGAGTSSVFGPGGPALGGALRGMAGGGGGGGIGVRRGDGGVVGASIAAGSLGPLGDDDIPPNGIGLPAKERVPVTVVVDRFDHQDGLSRDEIARVMDRARSQVKACYERELGGAPGLEGKVVLAFTIASSGAVSMSTTAQNTLLGAPGARTGTCIERVVRRLKFPSPRGGGVVQVTYPFVLAVSGG